MNVGGQSGLSDIVNFFNTQANTSDVSSALQATAVAFKVAMFIIMIVGGIAMAIWIGRIAVDILCIVTRGTAIESKMATFGTGKSDDYSSVGKYLKGNLLEIILVIILIVFLMTGWLFRLIALALSGFGTLANKLLGLDIGGTLSALDAQAYTENIVNQRTNNLRIQYDDELATARQYANLLYEQAKNGAVGDDPTFVKNKSMYTQAMARATVISNELQKRGAAAELKLGSNYFQQHKRTAGDGVCNRGFVLADVEGKYGVSVSCSAN